MKKKFRKAPFRVALFKSIAPEIRLLPRTYFNALGVQVYYYENFQLICSVINDTLNENDA